jgi:hypothetical protein
MKDEKLGPKARETFARLEREEPPLFPVVLGEHMDEAGIEDLEELHRRYLEAGGDLDLETFRHEVRADSEDLYRGFVTPLRRVFGIADGDADSATPLALTYALGRFR